MLAAAALAESDDGGLGFKAPAVLKHKALVRDLEQAISREAWSQVVSLLILKEDGAQVPVGIHLIEEEQRPAFLDREVAKMVTTLLRKENKACAVGNLVAQLFLAFGVCHGLSVTVKGYFKKIE